MRDEAEGEYPGEEVSDGSYQTPPIASSPPPLPVVAGPSHAGPGSRQVGDVNLLVKIESDEEVELGDPGDDDEEAPVDEETVRQHEEEALADALANVDLDREFDEVRAMRDLEAEDTFLHVLEHELARAEELGVEPFADWFNYSWAQWEEKQNRRS